jgi:hypothetical protein
MGTNSAADEDMTLIPGVGAFERCETGSSSDFRAGPEDDQCCGCTVTRSQPIGDACDPEFWAETISWFLALLPDDAEVVCMTEAVPEPVPMPRHADPDQIVSVLESLRA